MILTTERLALREFDASDQSPLLAILSDPRVMEFSINGPMEEDGVERFVASCRESYRAQGFGQWALMERAGDRLIGFCGISHVELGGRPEIELGYRLAHDRWGQGLATEAGDAVVEAAFSRWQLESVVAIIARRHVASLNVARKLGFQFDFATQFGGWDVEIHRCRAVSQR